MRAISRQGCQQDLLEHFSRVALAVNFHRIVESLWPSFLQYNRVDLYGKSIKIIQINMKTRRIPHLEFQIPLMETSIFRAVVRPFAQLSRSIADLCFSAYFLIVCEQLQKSFTNSFTVLNKAESAERTEPRGQGRGDRRGSRLNLCNSHYELLSS